MMWWWFVRSTLAAAPEGGFDAHGFRFVSAYADPLDPFGFPRAGDIEPLQWSVAALGEYASRPLRFVAPDGTEQRPLQNLVAVNVAGGFAPVDKLRIDLSMPAYLASEDDAGTSGPAPGDLRASVMFVGVEPSQASGFGLGLLAALDAPTGTPARWLGTTGPAGLLGLSSTFEAGIYAVSLLAASRLAPSTDPDLRPAPTQGGDTVEGALAFAANVSEGVGVGIEARASVALDAAVRTAIGIPAMAEATFRYATDGGGYVSGGIGTALTQGAGGSPVRVVLGGGFGGSGRAAPKDPDLDGISGRVEICPEEPETVNGYKDEDGCPDLLPQVEFIARRADREEPEAALVVKRPDGAEEQGTGRAVVSGMPGESLDASARSGACFGGSVEAKMPAEGRIEVTIPVARLEAEVAITVTDGVGRPLSAAIARYIVDDEACEPSDTTLVAGKGVHTIGAGPTTVFLTAPGYGVHQATLTPQPGERLSVEAKLTPTQIAIREGAVRFSKSIEFRSNTASLADSSQSLVDQLASLLLLTPASQFEIAAWAPPGGSTRLGQQRAEAVLAALVALGVPSEALVAVGKGGKPPSQKDWVAVQLRP